MSAVNPKMENAAVGVFIGGQDFAQQAKIEDLPADTIDSSSNTVPSVSKDGASNTSPLPVRANIGSQISATTSIAAVLVKPDIAVGATITTVDAKDGSSNTSPLPKLADSGSQISIPDVKSTSNETQYESTVISSSSNTDTVVHVDKSSLVNIPVEIKTEQVIKEVVPPVQFSPPIFSPPITNTAAQISPEQKDSSSNTISASVKDTPSQITPDVASTMSTVQPTTSDMAAHVIAQSSDFTQQAKIQAEIADATANTDVTDVKDGASNTSPLPVRAHTFVNTDIVEHQDQSSMVNIPMEVKTEKIIVQEVPPVQFSAPVFSPPITEQKDSSTNTKLPATQRDSSSNTLAVIVKDAPAQIKPNVTSTMSTVQPATSETAAHAIAQGTEFTQQAKIQAEIADATANTDVTDVKDGASNTSPLPVRANIGSQISATTSIAAVLVKPDIAVGATITTVNAKDGSSNTSPLPKLADSGSQISIPDVKTTSNETQYESTVISSSSNTDTVVHVDKSSLVNIPVEIKTEQVIKEVVPPVQFSPPIFSPPITDTAAQISPEQKDSSSITISASVKDTPSQITPDVASTMSTVQPTTSDMAAYAIAQGTDFTQQAKIQAEIADATVNTDVTDVKDGASNTSPLPVRAHIASQIQADTSIASMMARPMVTEGSVNTDIVKRQDQASLVNIPMEVKTEQVIKQEVPAVQFSAPVFSPPVSETGAQISPDQMESSTNTKLPAVHLDSSVNTLPVSVKDTPAQVKPDMTSTMSTVQPTTSDMAAHAIAQGAHFTQQVKIEDPSPEIADATAQVSPDMTSTTSTVRPTTSDMATHVIAQGEDFAQQAKIQAEIADATANTDVTDVKDGASNTSPLPVRAHTFVNTDIVEHQDQSSMVNIPMEVKTEKIIMQEVPPVQFSAPVFAPLITDSEAQISPDQMDSSTNTKLPAIQRDSSSNTLGVSVKDAPAQIKPNMTSTMSTVQPATSETAAHAIAQGTDFTQQAKIQAEIADATANTDVTDVKDGASNTSPLPVRAHTFVNTDIVEQQDQSSMVNIPTEVKTEKIIMQEVPPVQFSAPVFAPPITDSEAQISPEQMDSSTNTKLPATQRDSSSNTLVDVKDGASNTSPLPVRAHIASQINADTSVASMMAKPLITEGAVNTDIVKQQDQASLVNIPMEVKTEKIIMQEVPPVQFSAPVFAAPITDSEAQISPDQMDSSTNTKLPAIQRDSSSNTLMDVRDGASNTSPLPVRAHTFVNTDTVEHQDQGSTVNIKPNMASTMSSVSPVMMDTAALTIVRGADFTQQVKIQAESKDAAGNTHVTDVKDDASNTSPLPVRVHAASQIQTDTSIASMIARPLVTEGSTTTLHVTNSTSETQYESTSISSSMNTVIVKQQDRASLVNIPMEVKTEQVIKQEVPAVQFSAPVFSPPVSETGAQISPDQMESSTNTKLPAVHLDSSVNTLPVSVKDTPAQVKPDMTSTMSTVQPTTSDMAAHAITEGADFTQQVKIEDPSPEIADATAQISPDMTSTMSTVRPTTSDTATHVIAQGADFTQQVKIQADVKDGASNTSPLPVRAHIASQIQADTSIASMMAKPLITEGSVNTDIVKHKDQASFVNIPMEVKTEKIIMQEVPPVQFSAPVFSLPVTDSEAQISPEVMESSTNTKLIALQKDSSINTSKITMKHTTSQVKPSVNTSGALAIALGKDFTQQAKIHADISDATANTDIISVTDGTSNTSPLPKMSTIGSQFINRTTSSSVSVRQSVTESSTITTNIQSMTSETQYESKAVHSGINTDVTEHKDQSSLANMPVAVKTEEIVRQEAPVVQFAPAVFAPQIVDTAAQIKPDQSESSTNTQPKKLKDSTSQVILAQTKESVAQVVPDQSTSSSNTNFIEQVDSNVQVKPAVMSTMSTVRPITATIASQVGVATSTSSMMTKPNVKDTKSSPIFSRKQDQETLVNIPVFKTEEIVKQEAPLVEFAPVFKPEFTNSESQIEPEHTESSTNTKQLEVKDSTSLTERTLVTQSTTQINVLQAHSSSNTTIVSVRNTAAQIEGPKTRDLSSQVKPASASATSMASVSGKDFTVQMEETVPDIMDVGSNTSHVQVVDGASNTSPLPKRANSAAQVSAMTSNCAMGTTSPILSKKHDQSSQANIPAVATEEIIKKEEPPVEFAPIVFMPEIADIGAQVEPNQMESSTNTAKLNLKDTSSQMEGRVVKESTTQVHQSMSHTSSNTLTVKVTDTMTQLERLETRNVQAQIAPTTASTISSVKPETGDATTFAEVDGKDFTNQAVIEEPLPDNMDTGINTDNVPVRDGVSNTSPLPKRANIGSQIVTTTQDDTTSPILVRKSDQSTHANIPDIKHEEVVKQEVVPVEFAPVFEPQLADSGSQIEPDQMDSSCNTKAPTIRDSTSQFDKLNTDDSAAQVFPATETSSSSATVNGVDFTQQAEMEMPGPDNRDTGINTDAKKTASFTVQVKPTSTAVSATAKPTLDNSFSNTDRVEVVTQRTQTIHELKTKELGINVKSTVDNTDAEVQNAPGNTEISTGTRQYQFSNSLTQYDITSINSSSQMTIHNTNVSTIARPPMKESKTDPKSIKMASQQTQYELSSSEISINTEVVQKKDQASQANIPTPITEEVVKEDAPQVELPPVVFQVEVYDVETQTTSQLRESGTNTTELKVSDTTLQVAPITTQTSSNTISKEIAVTAVNTMMPPKTIETASQMAVRTASAAMMAKPVIRHVNTTTSTRYFKSQVIQQERSVSDAMVNTEVVQRTEKSCEANIPTPAEVLPELQDAQAQIAPVISEKSSSTLVRNVTNSQSQCVVPQASTFTNTAKRPSTKESKVQIRPDTDYSSVHAFPDVGEASMLAAPIGQDFTQQTILDEIRATATNTMPAPERTESTAQVNPTVTSVSSFARPTVKSESTIAKRTVTYSHQSQTKEVKEEPKTVVRMSTTGAQTNPVTIIDFVPVTVDSTVQFETQYYFSEAPVQATVPILHQGSHTVVESHSESSATMPLPTEQVSSQTKELPMPEPVIKIEKSEPVLQMFQPPVPETRSSVSQTYVKKTQDSSHDPILRTMKDEPSQVSPTVSKNVTTQHQPKTDTHLLQTQIKQLEKMTTAAFAKETRVQESQFVTETRATSFQTSLDVSNATTVIDITEQDKAQQASPRLTEGHTVMPEVESASASSQHEPSTTDSFMQAQIKQLEKMTFAEYKKELKELGLQWSSEATSTSSQFAPTMRDDCTDPSDVALKSTECQASNDMNERSSMTEMTLEDIESLLEAVKKNITNTIREEMVVPTLAKPDEMALDFDVDTEDTGIQTLLETISRSASPILQEMKNMAMQYERTFEMRDKELTVIPDTLEQAINTARVKLESVLTQHEIASKHAAFQAQSDVSQASTWTPQKQFKDQTTQETMKYVIGQAQVAPASVERGIMPEKQQFGKASTQAFMEVSPKWTQYDVDRPTSAVQAGVETTDGWFQTKEPKQPIFEPIQQVQQKEEHFEFYLPPECVNAEIQTDPVIIKSFEDKDDMETETDADSGIEMDMQTDSVVVMTEEEYEELISRPSSDDNVSQTPNVPTQPFTHQFATPSHTEPTQTQVSKLTSGSTMTKDTEFTLQSTQTVSTVSSNIKTQYESSIDVKKTQTSVQRAEGYTDMIPTTFATQLQQTDETKTASKTMLTQAVKHLDRDLQTVSEKVEHRASSPSNTPGISEVTQTGMVHTSESGTLASKTELSYSASQTDVLTMRSRDIQYMWLALMSCHRHTFPK
ncbi:uncharacterized threonine-rich GPI-anchored glycoprotein PJ4664.02-like [Strongylocentrotus purpuratus]|uniref:Uncharacterized protein n=1 Tax=Strongylocentrotus purpuratus TaxID=7668 RepID=A0A7M7PPK6_STRPU|nr:uncharacterized threonine-rich GPI-anchored glycoprotein PJ4664.02-like [Strongylocentrotus purpuratus]